MIYAKGTVELGLGLGLLYWNGICFRGIVIVMGNSVVIVVVVVSLVIHDTRM